MKDQTLLVTSLKTLTPVAWACLCMAIASLVVSFYAWLPLQAHSTRVVFPMHLATMAILFTVFGVMAKHHWIAWGKKEASTFKVSFPTAYWIGVFASFGYFLIIFFGAALYFPHGTDLGTSVSLRIFSGGWLFLSLGGLGFAQWAGLRLRAYRAAT